MSHYTENFPPYANLTQAMFGGKLVYSYALGRLVDGTPVDLADALKGGHATLGYGFSMVPDAHAVPMTTASKELHATIQAMSTKELAESLEAALADPGMQSAGKIDVERWKKVLMFIIPLLLRIFI